MADSEFFCLDRDMIGEVCPIRKGAGNLSCVSGVSGKPRCVKCTREEGHIRGTPKELKMVPQLTPLDGFSSHTRGIIELGENNLRRHAMRRFMSYVAVALVAGSLTWWVSTVRPAGLTVAPAVPADAPIELTGEEQISVGVYKDVNRSVVNI